jgi:hypothetical protein
VDSKQRQGCDDYLVVDGSYAFGKHRAMATWFYPQYLVTQSGLITPHLAMETLFKHFAQRAGPEMGAGRQSRLSAARCAELPFLPL